MTTQVWYQGAYEDGFPAAWVIYNYFKRHKPIDRIIYQAYTAKLPQYNLDDYIYVLAKPERNLKYKYTTTLEQGTHKTLALAVWAMFCSERAPLLLRYCAKQHELKDVEAVIEYIKTHPMTFLDWDELYAQFEFNLGRVLDRAQAMQQHKKYVETLININRNHHNNGASQ